MTVTLPKLSGEKRANLYERANACRRANDYDRAMGIYESILSEDLADAEAYWSIVLCKYGIEYVEDPQTRKRIPTCNRTRTVSVFEDEDYRQAIVYASGEAKAFYEEEAATIDAIQKSILDISNREASFDIFICYKETDDRGRRTPDSVIAQELYGELTDEGYKVFFSRITLENKLGEVYEPYIFAALNSARVMVVVGTRVEYFDSVWVKNEWSRYISLIREGAKKTLIPAYANMEPKDLPEEFVRLQAQNMDNLGFMQDLVRGIKKIIPTKKEMSLTFPTFWVKGAAGRITKLNIDETSKTVLGIVGEPGNCIVIPSEVEAIAPGAFMNTGGIIVASIDSETLTSIPKYAFAGCKDMETVMFSDKITSVANNAFENCTALESVNLPEAIESTGERVFAGCTALNDILFNDCLKTVDESAFAGCTNLENMDFNNGLKTVKKNAFAGCTRLQSVTFPDDFECIEEGAFEGCIALKDITVSGNVSIAPGAFEGCVALKDITVSGNVSIAPGAFEGCVNIENITIEGERLESLLWLAPFFKDKHVNVTVSDDIKIIGEGAFRGCEFLTPIQIPDDTREIGKNAFAGLACITKIAVPDGVTVIGEGAFSECTGLKEISFDSHSRLLTIGDKAFAGCTRLTKIKIPNTVQSVGANAFDGCDNLKVIYITPYSTTEKLYKKKKIVINHPAVTFSHDDVERVEKSIHTTITISPKARSIDEQAFRFYSGIKSVEIPGKVEHIGTEAFEGCAGLESIVFPKSVKYISAGAFKDCAGLKTLVIPDTVEKIGAEAFSGCAGIRELVVPAEALNGSGIFKGCNGLKKIVFLYDTASVPDVIRIPDETFMYCTGLESVTFPLADRVWLGTNAFAKCTALKDVIFQYPTKKNYRNEIIMSDVFANTPFLNRYNLEQERRSKGLCIHCGGKLNFFTRKCKECGKKAPVVRLNG
jgi:hypothetical protein